MSYKFDKLVYTKYLHDINVPGIMCTHPRHFQSILS